MRRWTLSLLSILMLAIAIAVSTPAVRKSATASFQTLKNKAPVRAFSTTLFQKKFDNEPRQTSILSISKSTTRRPQTLDTSTRPFHPAFGNGRQDSSIATHAEMASSSPFPEDGTPAQATPESIVETLANKSAAERELPKLSVQEFRVYNRLAIIMDAYHNHFRYTWNILYKSCETGSRPAGISLRAFISQGLHFCHALTIHHTIEEQHVFPELAERMPAFAPKDHLISQHEMIHEGLEQLQDYLDKCRTGETELRLSELKVVMDGFGEVLWRHLDDEVRMLGAENMRRFWSKEEILSMNW